MFGDNVLKTDSNEMELVDFRIFKKTENKVYENQQVPSRLSPFLVRYLQTSMSFQTHFEQI